MDLLPKIRKINAMLQNTCGLSFNYREMSKTLCEVIDTNVFILGTNGKLLGYALAQKMESERMDKILKASQFPKDYINNLFYIQDTYANVDIKSEFTAFPDENRDLFKNGLTTIVPIAGGEERLGTLILSRMDRKFDHDDLILTEYSATVFGIEILRERLEKAEEEKRSKAIVRKAIGSLSNCELDAIKHIMEELNGKEGLLVASRIADRIRITRSVIVNALRKLESAGIIESRSLGMKGTFIRVLNDKLYFQLDKVDRHRDMRNYNL